MTNENNINATAIVEENTAAIVEDTCEVWELIPNVDELISVEENTASKVNLEKSAKMQKARAKKHEAKAKAKAKAEKAAQREKAKAEKEAAKAAIAAKTLPYKNGRWVKVHAIGETEYTSANNVMDITSSDGVTITADATYTANTRNFAKAAYWMLRYLGHAEATQIINSASSEVNDRINEAEKDAVEVKFSGDGWAGYIAKIAKNAYKTHIEWQRKNAA